LRRRMARWFSFVLGRWRRICQKGKNANSFFLYYKVYFSINYSN
jgi:hypothetical protein